MADQTSAQPTAYTKPVLESLGSLRELTAAGGPTIGVDSAYVHGSGNFGVS